MGRVIRGDRVQVLCASWLEDGTWLEDETDRERPLWLKAGQTMRLQPITDALIGMTIGERKTVVIPPERGFGLPDPEHVFAVDLATLPRDIGVGEKLIVEQGKAKIGAVVVSIDADQAIVDANHPLAGRTMTVEIQLLSIDR